MSHRTMEPRLLFDSEIQYNRGNLWGRQGVEKPIFREFAGVVWLRDSIYNPLVAGE